MLWFTVILFAITNCVAREIASDVTEPDVYNINAVKLTVQPSGTESRIIGGSPADIRNYPYAVQVLHNSRLACGGSILTVRHVLSAAHCFVDTASGVPIAARFYSIRAGTATLNQGGSVVAVTRVALHEQYVHAIHDNDIAVLQLNSRLSLGSGIQRASIPAQGDVVPDNSTVVVIGWGSTSTSGTVISPVLNQVGIRVVNRGVCATNYAVLAQIYQEYLPITVNMMCAGLLGIGGADACQGDSGGPLIYGGVVVGVTSWGYTCAHPTYPGVYAQVSRYTTWINSTVNRLGGGAASSRSGLAAIVLPVIFVMLSV